MSGLYCWGFKKLPGLKMKGSPKELGLVFSHGSAVPSNRGLVLSDRSDRRAAEGSEALLSHCYVPGSLHTLWQLTEVIFGVRPIY